MMNKGRTLNHLHPIHMYLPQPKMKVAPTSVQQIIMKIMEVIVKHHVVIHWLMRITLQILLLQVKVMTTPARTLTPISLE